MASSRGRPAARQGAPISGRAASQGISSHTPSAAAMASHSTTNPLPLLLALLLSCSAASAFNITLILDQAPEFGTFNSYLSQTNLSLEINHRKTITVLAVDNSAISALSGQPLNVVKEVLSAHVVLDFYDVEKLRRMNRRSTILTTLFQTTGVAGDNMGFLNVSKTPNGIRIGSAEPGADLNVQLVKTVARQPYDISVLQVSGVIVPPGIGEIRPIATPPPPPPAPAPKKAPAAPAPAPAASSPEAESPDAVSPRAPSAPADAPAADAPAPSKDASPSDAPAADVPAVDQVEAPSRSKSSGTKVVFGAGLAAVMAAAAMLAAF